MSLRDISGLIKEMYDTKLSHTVLSQITDRIIPEVKDWQSRPLEPVYCIVWLDVMHYKVRDEGACNPQGAQQHPGHQPQRLQAGAGMLRLRE